MLLFSQPNDVKKKIAHEKSSSALSSEIIDTKITFLTPFSLPRSISGKGERSIKLCCNTKENPSVDSGGFLFRKKGPTI